MLKYLHTLSPEDCYGCGACEQVCAHSAITLSPNEEGFLYPVMDEDKCVHCTLCERACPIDHNHSSEVLKTYAAQYQDESLMLSASGGLFKAIADYVLAQGGYVAGCVFDDKFNAIHILSNQPKDVERMQGSKYVQSKMSNVYVEVRDRLKAGSWVLFSGTPCQVAGLKGFLVRDYDKLITLDLICHGVPSPMLLQDYLDTTYRKSWDVIDFKFRNKQRNGWCSQGSVKLSRSKDLKIKKTTPYTDSYYYYYYLQNSISRYCCYSCKYSSTHRVGDITIGDYWGLQDVLPEFDCKNGASLALINTSKGLSVVEAVRSKLLLEETKLEDAVRTNGNLSAPCDMPANRRTIYKDIREKGYIQTAKDECHYQYALPMIKRIIPKRLKQLIKKILR